MSPLDMSYLSNVEKACFSMPGGGAGPALDLERRGGRTPEGSCARIAQRLLAMAVCIWHNWATAGPVKRSLTAYDN